MLNCKESSHLLSEALDRPLESRERLQLEFHLLLCAGCRNYRRQMDFLRQASRQLAHGEHPDDEAERR